MDSSEQLAQRAQSSRSNHASRPVHSRWLLPGQTHPYDMDDVLPQQERNSAQYSDNLSGVHAHPSLQPQYVSYDTQYSGQEFQRQPAVNGYFSGATLRASTSEQTTPSSYEDLYQTSSTSGIQHYGGPPSSNRGLWTTYPSSDTFTTPSALPSYGPVSVSGPVPVPPDRHGQSSTAMVPLMSRPVDTYGQPLQQSSHQPSPEVGPTSGLSALNAYFHNTTGTSSAYLSGNLHRQPGQ